jgi:hypothetical protein
MLDGPQADLYRTGSHPNVVGFIVRYGAAKAAPWSLYTLEAHILYHLGF